MQGKERKSRNVPLPYISIIVDRRQVRKHGVRGFLTASSDFSLLERIDTLETLRSKLETLT